MDNETKIKLSFANSVTGEKKLEEYEERLKNIYGLIDGLGGSQSQNTMDKISKDASKLDKNVKSANTSSIKLAETLRKAFNVAKVVAMTKSLWKLTQTMMKLSQKSVEYIENVNLLQVAYHNQNEEIEESSKRIQTYIDKMSEVYGLDESRLTRQFGIFKQLANAMQLPTETAENLSEIMVKMTNDIASLYNLDLNRASNALQSALAGQVRPIRSATGADITEKTLQNTVDDLGLDRSISQLSYVEKRLVMVISLTQQLKNSQGDYARTIESASNQIRVMKEQWDRLSRAVGNVFYPILEAVLPYINAILMALTEVVNLIARLVGYKMPKFNYDGLTGVSDTAMDIEDEMIGAGEATDELASKLKGLRGFDKLNVISSPSNSGKSSSGAGGGAGGIDPKIMDAFNNAFANYNDMMDTVQMKATKIRDSIMEWLGFTKLVDEATGEISWKYEGMGIQLEGILGALASTGSSIVDLFETVARDIVTAFENNNIGETIFFHIQSTITNIIEIIGGIAEALNEAFSNGDKGVELFENLFEIANEIWSIIDSISRSLKKWVISDSFKSTVDHVVKVITDIFDSLSGLGQWLKMFWIETLEPLVTDLLIFISDIINLIGDIWDIAKPVVDKICSVIGTMITPALKTTFKLIDDIIKILSNLLRFISAVFRLDWEEAWNSIVGMVQHAWDFIVDFGQGIIGVFSGLKDGVHDAFKGMTDFVINVWKTAFDTLKEGVKNVAKFFAEKVDAIKEAFITGFNVIKDTVSGIWNTITGLFSTGGDIFNGIVNGVANVFTDIVNGLIDGINWIIAQPFNTINGVLNGIRNWKILGNKPFKGLWGENPIWVPEIPHIELALGGMPEVGQLFVANEKGPELVGQIGGQSFVANQNQMMDLLDKKIGNTQNQKQVFNIYLDDSHLLATYTLDQLQEQARTNGNAIRIG